MVGAGLRTRRRHQKSARQQNVSAAGYRTERSLMGCFTPRPLRRGGRSNPSVSSEQVLGSKGVPAGFDWPHRDKLEGEAVEERFELERYSRFGLI